MINKVGASMYLKQPFKYSNVVFTDGRIGLSVVPNDYPNSYYNYGFYGVSGSKTLDSTNYKSKITAFVPTMTSKFFNALTTPHGGVKIDSVHIGRVFNRSLLPTDTDCFFSSGNMGSSNGTVTPSIPVEWTPEDKRKSAKAEVYVVNTLNTGGVGTAKFRYATYPFLGFFDFLGGLQQARYSSRDYHSFYSESISYHKEKSGTTIYANVGMSNLNHAVEGICVENRLFDDGSHITFVLAPEKNVIHFYTDPTLIKLDYSINLNVSLEVVTYANGAIYGINNNKVYKINIVDGSETEITLANQNGENCFILASPDGSRVYCFSDGNAKIIHTTDDSVTTPENSLPMNSLTIYTVPSPFQTFNIDIENNVWYLGKKYDKDTLELILSIDHGDYATMYHGNYFISRAESGTYGDYSVYKLDGTKKSVGYVGSYSYDGYVYMQTSRMLVTPSSLNIMPLSLKDITRSKYRGDQKDWRIYDGSSWVKGWYEDETPTGTIGGGNLTFTCQNVPTALLSGTLEITVDGGTPITDNGDGTLSDGGSVTYSTGEFTLAAENEPTSTITVYYELTSDMVTGSNVALQDGVEVSFADGTETPHFVEGDYFSFTVAEGHIVDNLEEYSASVDLYVVPFHDISDETFTISATAMDVAATVNTGFIKVESDIGLTGTIAGTEATIITSGDPVAGQIKIDYNSGALTFHADDVGSTAVISYRWLERPE